MATKLDKYTHVIKAVSEKGKTRFSYTNDPDNRIIVLQKAGYTPVEGETSIQSEKLVTPMTKDEHKASLNVA